MRVAVAVSFLLAGCHGCSPDQQVAPTTPAPIGTVKIGARDRTAPPAPPGEESRFGPEEGTIRFHAAAATAGGPGRAELRVATGHGYEINEKAIWKLTLEPTPGVTLPKASFRGGGKYALGDATLLDAGRLAIDIPFTIDRPGDSYAIRGNLDFAVCKSNTCLTKSVPVAVQVAAR
jgi:hypothetical protein